MSTGTVVLLAAGEPPKESLARIIAKLKDAGADVVLAGMTDVERTHADVGADRLRSIQRNVVTDPELYRVTSAALPARRVWWVVERDKELIAICRAARVLVALDTVAVYSVWEIGRQVPGLLLRQGAVAGYTAFIEHAQSLSEWAAAPPVPPSTKPVGLRARVGRAGRAALRSSLALTGPARAAWPVLLSNPRVSSERRGRIGADLVARLYASGRPRAAAQLCGSLHEGLRTARDRADLLGGVVARLVDRGTIPPDLRVAVAAELRYADELLTAGDGGRAAGSLLQARRLAFDQGVHLSHTTSPLAEDPSGFTAPLRSSATVATISRPRGRVAPAAPMPLDRPPRVVIATQGNTNFVRQLERHLVDDRQMEVRSIDLADLGRAARLVRDPWRLLSSLLQSDGVAEKLAERHLREHLEWADVVFVDWCTALVRVVNLVDPGTTRIVVRLHSYEAFTIWPHLLDVSRIDDFVFVSEHVQDLVLAQVPALAGPEGPRVRVVPNALDLRPFVREKHDSARFTIGLIGYHVVAKDPLWALAVLRLVREHDPRYRLRLIGQSFNLAFSRAAEVYGEKFERELAILESEGAVHRYGYSNDLPTAVEQVGVVLCSSVREGSPVAFLEAAASGAVPVVRDWPFFAQVEHGPRTMYPTDWVVDSPQEAAARIIALTQDVAGWRLASREASATVLASWDLSTTGNEYESLLLGTASQVDGSPPSSEPP